MSWPMVKLGELFKVSSGGTPSRRKPQFYEGGTIPWVKTGDLHNKYVTEASEYITQDGLDGSSARIYPEGTVLVAMYGATIGACSILDIDACTNQACAAFTPNSEVDINFLYYLLKRNKSTFVKAGSGGAQPNISATFLKEFEIPLPPLDEQKRIAAILDKADAIRRKRQQAIHLADDFLRSVFLDMFGDPVTNPKGLELAPFSTIADFINGDRSSNYPSGSDLIEEGVLFLSTKNIVDNQLNFKETAFISQEKFESLSRGKLKRKDLVITLRGTLGSCAIFDSDFDTGFINAQIMILRCKEQVLPEYLHALLTSNPIHSMFQRIGQGAAVPQLTASQLKELRLPIPSIESQKKFIGVLEVSKNLIAKFSLKDRNLLFESLSQIAFAGKL